MSDEQEDGIDPVNFKSMTEKRDKKKADEKGEPMLSMAQVIELMGKSQSNALTPESLRVLLQEVGKSNATAMQAAVLRENPNYVAVTPYTRPDGSRPDLTRALFFGTQTEGRPPRVDPEALTPIEIELANRFERGRKMARDGRWTADVIMNGTQEELHIKVPMATADERQDLPSLSSIMRELLDGQKAANPDALAERVAELEAKLAAVSA